jgi:hypothetical protein
VSFAGFDLHDDELTEGDVWFFVLQEHLTEPRFGFDEASTEALTSWSNASWVDTGVDPGKYLKIQGNPLNTGTMIEKAVFGKNSAHMAFITLQKPMRVAIHGKQMVEV